jgi:hypothetical protein
MTRRAFVTGAAAAAGASLTSRGVSGLEPGQPAGPGAGQPAGPRAVNPGDLPAEARVVEGYSEFVVVGQNLQPNLLAEMMHESLRVLAGAISVKHALQTWFKPDDVIGIKANSSGAGVIGTTTPVLMTLIDTLIDAGWPEKQIVLIEAPERVRNAYQTTPPMGGFSETEVDFGSGTDRFAAVLDQITALINVPFIKTHNIAGMTCGLKNLSHALVKHPAHYHANGCSPFIGDIVAAEPIRSKLRLTIVDGFRVVFDGGPEAKEENIHVAGRLLAGRDPAATDTMALQLLDKIRGERKLPPVGVSGPFLPYLDAASERGVGTVDLDFIRPERLTFG